MYQSLVVSPLFLKSFSSLGFENASAVMASLATEIFLCDINKKLLEEYDKIREEHKYNQQSLLFIENFIKVLTFGRVRPVSSVAVRDRNAKAWEKYEVEKLIASFDEWKIILTNKSKKEICTELEKELNIELSDAENYLEPSEKSRIRAIQRINKHPGDEFDFRNWMVKFIKDSNSLLIHDGYACAKNELRDAEFIIKTLPKGAKVKIFTLSDKARNNSRNNATDDGIVAEEILNELKNNNPSKIIEWELKDEKKLLEDRHIQTDKFIIDLGHALGSTYKDVVSGKILCKKQFTITVSKAS